jgi:hypothetical protein
MRIGQSITEGQIEGQIEGREQTATRVWLLPARDAFAAEFSSFAA